MRSHSFKAALIVSIASAAVLGIVWGAILISLQSPYPARQQSQAPLNVEPSSTPRAELQSTRTAPGGAPPTITHIDEPEPYRGIAARCRAELTQLCPGIEPGAGRLKRCIDKNMPKLSLTCQQQIEERIASVTRAIQHVRRECNEDAKRVCPAIELAGGRAVKCLKEHYKEVSEGCYQALVDLL